MWMRVAARRFGIASAAAFLAGFVVVSDGARADAAKPSPLVSTEWLRDRLNDPALLVLDVRSAIDGGGKEAFVEGHIPGAVHTDYDKAGWRVTRKDIPFMLPTLPELEKLVGELGIDEDKTVVVVPAGVHATDFGSAARVYWTLKYLGHEKVAILDGGFAAWKSERNKIETGERRPSPTIFTAAINKKLLTEVTDLETLDGQATLIDARAPSFFFGKEKSDRAAGYGHIPGAINVDSAELYDPVRNRLKPKELLDSAFGEMSNGPVVTYCNTGHWAATDWFVLSEILGHKDASLYAGSMVEWTADARRPIQSQRTKWDDLKKFLRLGS